MGWRWFRPAMLAGAVWSATAGSAAALCVRGVESWDTLRVRAAASSTARETGAIPAQACGVSITGPCRGAWCPVTWGGYRGWSNAAYLTQGGLLAFFTSPFGGLMAPPPTRSTAIAPRPRVARPMRVIAAGPPRSIAPQAPVLLPTPSPTRAGADTRLSAPVTTGSSVPAADRVPLAEPPPQPPIVTVPLRETANAATAVAPVAGPQPKFTSLTPGPPSGPPSGPTSGAVAPTDVCVIDIAKGDTLKVRAGPGGDQALRFGYPAGACGVKITGGCANGWCPVEYRGYRGWAEQKFLQ